MSGYLTMRPSGRESGTTSAFIVHELTEIRDDIPLGVGAKQATQGQD
jgi:hypothetical protein